MNRNLVGIILCLIFLVFPVYGHAEEEIHHSSDPLLFEVISDGKLTNDRVYLEFDASKSPVNGEIKAEAECRIIIIYFKNNKLGKHIELGTFRASTEDYSIKNLRVEPTIVSFDMTPFPMAPDRPLKFIATLQPVEKTHSSRSYKAKVVGLWTDLLRKGNLFNIEYRQVPKIELPYTTILPGPSF